jgi:tetratricopeptide (TPR) repeat protein/2-polyprenyl-3-methyl-5-hydroxy-6-metoxy-1,4-benzoquinol methylase
MTKSMEMIWTGHSSLQPDINGVLQKPSDRNGARRSSAEMKRYQLPYVTSFQNSLSKRRKMSTPNENRFRAAIASFQAGRLNDAEQQFKEVLRHQPKHPAVLNILGVLLAALEKYAEAEHYIRSALEITPSSDATLYNFGIVLKALKRPIEALERFDQALAINPSAAEIWNNCGAVLNDLHRYDDAIAKFDKAIDLQPNYAEAFYNKGRSLAGLWRPDQARAAYDKALALKPDLAEAWLARGIAFPHLIRDDEALAAIRRAHTLKPNLFEAVNALVCRLLANGDIAEALSLARRAVDSNETPEAKSLLGLCLCSPLLHTSLGDQRHLLLRALLESWARPAALAPNCTVFLKLNDAIRDSMERATMEWPKLLPAEEFAGPSNLAKLAADDLLRALLETVPIYGVELERFATGLRFCLLKAALSPADSMVPEQELSLYCALARQCFINNYVFSQSDREITEARELHDTVVAALASGADISALTIVAVATYLPLHSITHAESLLSRPWPEAVGALLKQQVGDPIEERRLRSSMPVLTTIDDDVSIKVRDQYEENPYPQWVRADPASTPKTVGMLMREKFPTSTFVELNSTSDVAILVAGCGTGRHSIDAARRFTAARVLAIDISLASLSYAKRQSHALGLDNIQYAQADILKLASIGRTFDIIEVSGVLHHLADPFAGWRVLLSLLRPAGIMLLGFYSEIARRDVVVARDFIAERGYRPTADDIRRSRQELFECTENASLSNVASFADFFSLSECRDLLFNVQEHRLTLPQIAAFLAENDLQLLGFDVDLQTRSAYAKQFPEDLAMTDLTLWHRYETDNPFAFAGMYQFWVQKKAGHAGKQ